LMWTTGLDHMVACDEVVLTSQDSPWFLDIY
jgi:hypothetical protein